MKIEKLPLEDRQIKLTVEVDPTTFETTKHKAARSLAKRVKIPGFRPGKAPYSVILRQIGESAILDEALELLVDEIYPKIIDESEIKPYGPGKLENVVSTDPPVLEFIVPLEAEVVLGDYRSLRLPYEPPVVSEKEFRSVLEDLRERQAVLEPVERPAQEGDMVYIRLSGKRLDEQQDEDPTIIRERSQQILVRSVDNASHSDEPEEWPFPGFSRELIGLSAGDKRSVRHTFADESGFESLRGVEAEFQVEVENIKSRALPELDDNFATSVGDYETLDQLQAEIRKELEERALDTYNEEYDSQIINQAVEQAKIKYPPQMLEREIDSVIDNLKQRLEQQSLGLDLYLKTRQMDMEGLQEEARPVAEARLKRSLFLLELAKAENIQVDEAEFKTETARTMDSLLQILDKKEARRLSDRRVMGNLAVNIMVDMLTSRAREHLRNLFSGKIGEIENISETPAAEESSSEKAEREPSIDSAQAGETGPAQALESDSTLTPENPPEGE